MAGISAYGSYVPFYRLQRAAVGAGKGERAVASYDEDSISMGVEAAREALRGRTDIDVLLFASTSAPYVEKLNAATLQAASGISPSLLALDSSGSSRVGLASLIAGLKLAQAGNSVLVVASDVTVGAPGGPRESGGGDAACAFVLGNVDGGAQLLGSASTTQEVLDVWRTPSMPFARQWEERFGEEVFLLLLGETFDRALLDAGVETGELKRVLLDGTNARALRGFAASRKFSPEQLGGSLNGAIGRCGAAHSGLQLASALDELEPGDRVAMVVAADGVDVVVMEVGEGIGEARPARSVERWVASKNNSLEYTSYLKWREILPFEPPRRPDPPRPAAPPVQRAEGWKFAFVASRCTACGAANLPPQRVCVACQAVDEMEPEPFADAACRIATYTIDRLAYSLHPPVVAAVVDFEKGGRFTCQLTDVDPEEVSIGDQLEMTFRRLYTADGVHNYFWKARPQR